MNDVYELWCQLKRGIKDSTMKNYIYMYELFVKPTFGKKKLVQVKKSDVRRFYNQLIDDKVLKPSKLDWMRKYKFRFRGVTRVRGGEKIIFFFLDEPQILVGKDKLIMLGDLFDRGHEAKQLQQFILEQMEQDKIILIRGNHEDLFVELVTTDAGMPYSYHKSNGTYDTALQLTGFDPVMASIRHYDFADAAKDTPFYKEIIPAMLDYFETEHYVFTHGWIPSIPNRDKSYSYISSWREADREQWNQARWFNGMDAAQTADENKTIVCGHWHTSYGHSKYEHKGTEFGEDADFSPYYGPGIIAIDACTAFSGKVNCLVIED